MSASSGISASQELAAAFADAVQSQSVRFLKVTITNESLVHQLSVPISSTFDQDLQLLQSEDVISSNAPAYILAKLDPPSQDWISIFYVPDTAQVREKMLYASTRASLLKSLGSSLFTDSIYATSKDDLTPEAYVAHRKHVAAPNPLSSREQELSDLRAAENEAASYSGSQARATHIGTGVGLGWGPGVEDALVELAQGSEDAILILSINAQAETLEVHSSSPGSPDQISAQFPTSQPCYAFFAWNHSFKSNPVRELIFIYSCPSSSPIKHRMLYSSGSGSTFQAAKSLISERASAVEVASRKIEVSDPHEINRVYLQDELGYSKAITELEAGAHKRFAKPKGPPRRR